MAAASGVRVQDAAAVAHFDVWFRQAYGIQPDYAHPGLALSVVRALYDAEFVAHVAEDKCTVFVGVMFGPRVECAAGRKTQPVMDGTCFDE